MIKFKRFLPVVLLSTSMLIPSKAYAAYGRIVDNTWYRSIVGVWVEVYGGESGWAHIKRQGDSQVADWKYETYGHPYSLHIGVGGDEENWAQNVKTDIIEDDRNHKYIEVRLIGSWFNQQYVAIVK